MQNSEPKDSGLTFSSRTIFNLDSVSWKARWNWEAFSSSSYIRRSFSWIIWRILAASASSFETLEAIAMDVIFRARSNWSYGSDGITDRISSGKLKPEPAFSPPLATFTAFCDMPDSPLPVFPSRPETIRLVRTLASLELNKQKKKTRYEMRSPKNWLFPGEEEEEEEEDRLRREEGEGREGEMSNFGQNEVFLSYDVPKSNEQKRGIWFGDNLSFGGCPNLKFSGIRFSLQPANYFPISISRQTA